MDEKFFPHTLDDYRIEDRTTKLELVPKIADLELFGHAQHNPHKLFNDYQVIRVPCLEQNVVLKGDAVEQNERHNKASRWYGYAIFSSLVAAISVFVYAVTSIKGFLVFSILAVAYFVYAFNKSTDLRLYPTIPKNQQRDFSKDYLVANTTSVEDDLELFSKSLLSNDKASLSDRFTKAYTHYLELRLQMKGN